MLHHSSAFKTDVSYFNTLKNQNKKRILVLTKDDKIRYVVLSNKQHYNSVIKSFDSKWFKTLIVVHSKINTKAKTK